MKCSCCGERNDILVSGSMMGNICTECASKHSEFIGNPQLRGIEKQFYDVAKDCGVENIVVSELIRLHRDHKVDVEYVCKIGKNEAIFTKNMYYMGKRAKYIMQIGYGLECMGKKCIKVIYQYENKKGTQRKTYIVNSRDRIAINVDGSVGKVQHRASSLCVL